MSEMLSFTCVLCGGLLCFIGLCTSRISSTIRSLLLIEWARIVCHHTDFTWQASNISACPTILYTEKGIERQNFRFWEMVHPSFVVVVYPPCHNAVCNDWFIVSRVITRLSLSMRLSVNKIDVSPIRLLNYVTSIHSKSLYSEAVSGERKCKIAKNLLEYGAAFTPL